MNARLTVLALLALGCGTPALTEIVVVADTDLSVPGDVDAIRISVSDASGTFQEGLADLGGGAPRPVTLGLVSSSGEGMLEVVVIGERGGIEILRRTARVSFERGRTLALRMDLWSRCVGELCGAERACGDDGCRAVVVDPAELGEWTGSPPPAPELDSGVDTSDGHVDGARPIGASGRLDGAARIDAWAPRDSGPPVDAGASIDAGPPGDAAEAPDAFVAIDGAWPDVWVAECALDAECDDGWSCTADTCAAGRCAHVTRDTACDDGIACTSERCDAALGCVYDARDAACDDGLSCTTNTCDRLLGCVVAPVHATCGSGSYCDTASGCAVAPTFTLVYSTILEVHCAPCHVTGRPLSGMLDMRSQAHAHSSLVGTVARCGAGANTRVVPGDPARSLLWRKVAGVDLCGARMPRMLTPLDDGQIAQIAHWIEGGALP